VLCRPVLVFVLVLLQVAIKKMKRKFFSWEECMALREVSSTGSSSSNSKAAAMALAAATARQQQWH